MNPIIISGLLALMVVGHIWLTSTEAELQNKAITELQKKVEWLEYDARERAQEDLETGKAQVRLVPIDF